MDPEENLSANDIKSIEKKGPRRLLIIASGLLLFAGLIYIADQWFNERAIERIEVSGTKLVKSQEILSLISDTLLIGKTRKYVNTKAIKKNAEKHPLVEKVIVSYSGIDLLKLKIIEKTSIAYILEDTGDLMGLDSNGSALPLPSTTKSMVVVTGAENDEYAAKKSAKLVMLLKAQNNFDKKISEVHYNSRTKDYELITLEKGFKFRIGKIGKYDGSLNEKINKIRAWLDSERSALMTETIDHIDARWKNQLVLCKN